MSIVKISMTLEKDTWYVAPHTRFTMPDKSVFVQRVQIKCRWRLFTKNLKDFNIQIFGQTVHYSASPSSNVSLNPLGSEEPPQFYVVPHFRYIYDIS